MQDGSLHDLLQHGPRRSSDRGQTLQAGQGVEDLQAETEPMKVNLLTSGLLGRQLAIKDI